MLKFVSSLFLILTITIFADTGYFIDNYKINIQINENNIYDIQEQIDVNLIEDSSGIYRIIPTVYNGRELKITDVKTNVKTTLRNEGEQIFLKLGDGDKKVKGKKEYHIHFKHDLGWDRNIKQDEVYYNIIGNDWDTTINKVEFKIELPKEFTPELIKFTRGKKGSLSSDFITYEIRGNIIKGEITKKLEPNEGITLALVLPEGYFNIKMNQLEKIKYFFFKAFAYLAILLIPLNAIIQKIRYRDKKQVVKTVEFYPPDDITPPEVAYYYNGIVDYEDFVYLFYYWGNKGYLSISEEIDGKIFAEPEIYITFNKSRIGSNKEFENFLFNGICFFKNEDNRVKLSELKGHFYVIIERTSRLFYKSIEEENKMIYDQESLKIGKKIRATTVFLFPALIFYFLFSGPAWYFESALVVLGIIFSLTITMIISTKIKRRTEHAIDILGKLKGFKRFLEKAEKTKLIALLDENPDYFYNILPYTEIFKITKAWIKKFKGLVVKPPSWYYGPREGQKFTLSKFLKEVEMTKNEINDTMLASPKETTNKGGGNSSRNGGSTGGGAGGGGGGRW